jgi:hypothetical protein
MHRQWQIYRQETDNANLYREYKFGETRWRGWDRRGKNTPSKRKPIIENYPL